MFGVRSEIYNKVEVSIILLIYNATEDAILRTLESILMQKNCSYKIIIADDGSKVDHSNLMKKFFLKKSFEDYIIVDDRKNLGTVGNSLRALKYVRSKYVKLIGAGDMFYDEETLYKVISFMRDRESQCVFTDISPFRIKAEHMEPAYFRTPISKKAYRTQRINDLQESLILKEDFILGAAIFCQTDILINSLNKMKDYVKYYEDWFQIILVLENIKIQYVPIKGIYYEMGSGISTSNRYNEEYLKDYESFWAYLNDTYNNKFLIRRRNIKEKAKKNTSKISKFVHLICKYARNPIYRTIKLLRFSKLICKN